jgi:hypothetical protein
MGLHAKGDRQTVGASLHTVRKKRKKWLLCGRFCHLLTLTSWLVNYVANLVTVFFTAQTVYTKTATERSPFAG